MKKYIIYYTDKSKNDAWMEGKNGELILGSNNNLSEKEIIKRLLYVLSLKRVSNK